MGNFSMNNMGFEKIFNRKNYFINPKFQLTLIGLTSIILVAVIAVLWGANQYFFDVFIKMGREANFPENHIYFQFINDQFVMMNKIFLLVSIIMTFILGTFGIYISHKIAGPLYRLCSHMKNLKNGQSLTEVKFRKGDFFPELADAYNNQVRILNGKSKLDV